MRVLITGHDGYIGTVMAPFLEEAGQDDVGVDACFYRDCVFGDDEPSSSVPFHRMDVSDVDAELTYEINHRAHELGEEDFRNFYVRLREQGRLDDQLRWTETRRTAAHLVRQGTP